MRPQVSRPKHVLDCVWQCLKLSKFYSCVIEGSFGKLFCKVQLRQRVFPCFSLQRIRSFWGRSSSKVMFRLCCYVCSYAVLAHQVPGVVSIRSAVWLCSTFQCLDIIVAKPRSESTFRPILIRKKDPRFDLSPRFKSKFFLDGMLK